jgi:hypothetical protein
MLSPKMADLSAEWGPQAIPIGIPLRLPAQPEHDFDLILLQWAGFHGLFGPV